MSALLPPSLFTRALMLGNRAAAAANTYRRYAELSGQIIGDPLDEVWEAIAALAESIEELARLVCEQECAKEDRRG